MYQSRNLGWQVEKETSVSKEATSSISYRKLVSRRRPGAHSRAVATKSGLMGEGGGAGSNRDIFYIERRKVA